MVGVLAFNGLNSAKQSAVCCA